MTPSDPAKDFLHLFIQDGVSPDGGGIQNVAFHLALHMRNRGKRVAVAGKTDKALFSKTGIEVFTLKNPFRTRNSSDLRLLVLLLRLRLKYGRKVLLYSLLINNVKVFRWLRPFLGWECISFLHGNEVLRLSRRRKATLDRNILACRCVFANSRFTKGFVGKIRPYRNVTVLNPGICSRTFAAHPARDYKEEMGFGGRKIILMLSRLSKRKGHETVIRALSGLVPRYPHLLLLIAGEGGYRPKIERMVQEAGLSDHAIFLGRVNEENKLALYKACDVYCMPSEISFDHFEVEGFGITFLEAAAAGKIAIGSRSGGIPDAIEDGRSGFLIEPGDAKRLEVLLDDILSKPEAFEDMRRYARKRALEDFSWEKQGDRAIDLVERAFREAP